MRKELKLLQLKTEEGMPPTKVLVYVNPDIPFNIQDPAIQAKVAIFPDGQPAFLLSGVGEALDQLGALNDFEKSGPHYGEYGEMRFGLIQPDEGDPKQAQHHIDAGLVLEKPEPQIIIP